MVSSSVKSPEIEVLPSKDVTDIAVASTLEILTLDCQSVNTIAHVASPIADTLASPTPVPVSAVTPKLEMVTLDCQSVNTIAHVTSPAADTLASLTTVPVSAVDPTMDILTLDCHSVTTIAHVTSPVADTLSSPTPVPLSAVAPNVDSSITLPAKLVTIPPFYLGKSSKNLEIKQLAIAAREERVEALLVRSSDMPEIVEAIRKNSIILDEAGGKNLLGLDGFNRCKAELPAKYSWIFNASLFDGFSKVNAIYISVEEYIGFVHRAVELIGAFAIFTSNSNEFDGFLVIHN